MSLFGTRLKSLRDEAGITQEDLAAAFKVARSSVANYETRGKEPSFDALCEMAKYFDVSTDYILGLSSEKKNGECFFPGDNVGFKDKYDTVSSSLKPVLLRCFAAFYNVMSQDVKDSCPDRLPLYAELFETIAKYRKEISGKAAQVSAGADPLYVANLMQLQDNFKSDVGTIISRLTQADLQVGQSKRDDAAG